jgi:hypothetical protein
LPIKSPIRRQIDPGREKFAFGGTSHARPAAIMPKIREN